MNLLGADWKRKIQICRECPELRASIMQCKQCGCFVDLKAASGQKCPLNKW